MTKVSSFLSFQEILKAWADLERRLESAWEAKEQHNYSLSWHYAAGSLNGLPEERTMVDP